jgi:tRNA-intron endonuclease
MFKRVYIVNFVYFFMNKIPAQLVGEVLSTNEAIAIQMQRKSSFGEIVHGKVQYSLSEGLYLVKKGKIEVFQRGKKVGFNELIGKFKRLDNKIQLKYPVFKDLRDKGYVVKTALKFGADFRVYPKGKKPGKEHAKWIVFVEHESKSLKWHEFAAKNRVAHSTKKNLLLVLIDEESKPTYYEVSWIKT